MAYLVGFLLLLGILVFFHELGHFMVAKWSGVRVETFSIGFGPRVWSKRRGETEYTLSLIPLGGYVKMTGQDPREEVPAELASRSFANKPLSKRTAIVLGGPLANLLLAITLLTILIFAGLSAPAPTLARVLPDSAAFNAGFRSGDTINDVVANGEHHTIREWKDVEHILADHVGQNLSFAVTRTIDSKEQSLTIAATPTLGPVRDSSSGVVQQMGRLDGVETPNIAAVVVVEPKSWVADRLLPPGFLVDEITWSLKTGERVFQKIETFEDLENVWAAVGRKAQASPGEITIKGFQALDPNLSLDSTKENEKTAEKNADKEPELKTYTLAWSTSKDAPPEILAKAGIVSPETIISSVKEKSPAEKFGLKPGDRLLTLGGKQVKSFSWFREQIQSIGANGTTLTWLRNGQTMEAKIQSELVVAADPLTEAKKSQFQIGATFLALPANPPMTKIQTHKPFKAVAWATERSFSLTGSMLKSFYHLAKGEISPKTLGGPILIGKIAGESIKRGFEPFFNTMAFISLNLFLLNLFPIPVLDGGHLVLYAIEAIRRRPLSIKIVEAWTTTGFFLLMGLVALVFFNDLSRIGLFKIFN